MSALLRQSRAQELQRARGNLKPKTSRSRTRTVAKRRGWQTTLRCILEWIKHPAGYLDVEIWVRSRSCRVELEKPGGHCAVGKSDILKVPAQQISHCGLYIANQ